MEEEFVDSTVVLGLRGALKFQRVIARLVGWSDRNPMGDFY